MKKFNQSHIDEAIQNGFSDPRISHFSGRSPNTRFQCFWEGDKTTYSISWTLSCLLGHGSSNCIELTHNAPDFIDHVRDEDGRAYHNYSSFLEFMKVSKSHIGRREAHFLKIAERRAEAAARDLQAISN